MHSVLSDSSSINPEERLLRHFFKLWKNDFFPQTVLVRLQNIANSNKHDSFCQNFITTLLNRKIPFDSEGFAFSPHPDILVLKAKKEYFVIEELEVLFTFLESKAISLPQKLIIFPRANALGAESVSNKLLKTLENPPIKASFLLVIEGHKKLLATIEGRAIKFNLFFKQPSTTNQANNFYDFFCQNIATFFDLSEDKKQALQQNLKNWATSQDDFASLRESLALVFENDEVLKKMALSYVAKMPLGHSSPPHDIHLKKNIINILKDFEKAEKFRNPRASRQANLLFPLIG